MTPFIRMNRPIDHADRAAMVAAARRMLGVPFQHAGRNKNGVDCVGLLILASREAGIFIADDTSYSTVVNADYLWRRLLTSCTQIEQADAGIGDVVLFKINGSAQHVAMITEVEPRLSIIHSFQTLGRVVEHEFDRHWLGRVAGYFRPVKFSREVP